MWAKRCVFGVHLTELEQLHKAKASCGCVSCSLVVRQYHLGYIGDAYWTILYLMLALDSLKTACRKVS